MNKKTTPFLAGLLLFISVLFATPVRALPTANAELENPYKYFLRKSDFIYLYQLNPEGKLQLELSKLNEEFLDLIARKKYKESEKFLIGNYTNPYYLLNLVLLYVYLDQPEYKNLFQTWQESVDQKIIENFIEILVTRKFHFALEKLSRDFISPDLNRYALYNLYKMKNQPDLLSENFQKWREEYFLSAGKSPMPVLYEKALADWLFAARKNPRNKISRSKAAADDLSVFVEDLVRQKYTRDMLSRYINYLVAQNQWNEIRILVSRIAWLDENEKNNILQKTGEIEKTRRQEKPRGDYIKVIINPN